LRALLRAGSVATLFLASQWAVVRGAEARYPGDAGVIDVTKSPYWAKGDGRTDDTEALQQALLDHPAGNWVIYLPNGVYLVSNTLHWPGGPQDDAQSATILEGENRSGAVLKLMDYCPSFGVAGKAKAVLWTGDRGTRHYRNAIRNLTVDTGIGNVAAIGIQFSGNRQACVREVTINSGDGAGVAGLDMTQAEQTGPCLVKDLRVKGFEYGVRLAGALHIAVLESIDLEGQKVAGLRNAGLVAAVRDLRSVNECPAVQNMDATGLLTLLDATLKGLPTRRPTPAIVNRGMLFGRRLGTPGYTNSVENRAGHNEGASGPEVREFVSHGIVAQFPSPQYAMDLAVEMTPAPPPDPPSAWVAPARGTNAADDGPAIQAVIDGGAGTVYLPHGQWVIHSTVVLRGKVKRLLGCEARLSVRVPDGKPAFRIEDGESKSVLIERLAADSAVNPLIEQASGRDLAVCDCSGAGLTWIGNGDIFLENVWSPMPLILPKGRRLWARQWNVTAQGTKLLNDGGTAWLFGFSGEMPGTLIETRAGGKTELLGGLCNATGSWKFEPMLVVTDASASFTVGETSMENTPYQIIVEETRGGLKKRLTLNGLTEDQPLPKRVGGLGLPLYTGYVGFGSSAPSALLPNTGGSGK
jgi:Pectate lyase superfamily protein